MDIYFSECRSGHPFSTCAKFFENLTLPPDVYVRASAGKKC